MGAYVAAAEAPQSHHVVEKTSHNDAVPGEIAVDNESSKRFTILTVEVKVSPLIVFPLPAVFQGAILFSKDSQTQLLCSQDYPGLLRVIAWVVNGLDLLVENARCVLGLCCCSFYRSVPAAPVLGCCVSYRGALFCL